ncbi:MAG TPA: TadE/TadG family type IV pilus assembly protein [Sandaracinaceae bacterium]
MKRLVNDNRGAAYVEFLLAFIPLFVMFLGMVQMALMYAGDLVVQHAATRAARAAAVVLDDDPARYEDAPRMTVADFGVTSAENVLGDIVRLFGGDLSVTGIGTEPGGPRLAAIRTAASVPLVAISPSLDQLIRADSVRTAIGSPEARGATGLFLYNNAAMAVTFPERPNATSYRTSWEEGDTVTARVTYLFHCGVPLVNRMMCETYPTLRLGPAAAMAEGIIEDLMSGRVDEALTLERLRRLDEARRRHEEAQDAMRELEAAGADDLMYLTWLTGARFKVLRGEATMPVHAASYTY